MGCDRPGSAKRSVKLFAPAGATNSRLPSMLARGCRLAFFRLVADTLIGVALLSLISVNSSGEYVTGADCSFVIATTTRTCTCVGETETLPTCDTLSGPVWVFMLSAEIGRASCRKECRSGWALYH